MLLRWETCRIFLESLHKMISWKTKMKMYLKKTDFGNTDFIELFQNQV